MLRRIAALARRSISKHRPRHSTAGARPMLRDDLGPAKLACPKSPQHEGGVTEQPMIGRKDDPAFLYFPNNYRWSMGLLICLGAAPWTGIEIDEVHRVGRALEDHVGDDHAWFEEWTRMGEKVAARGREAQTKGHRLTAASCFM